MKRRDAITTLMGWTFGASAALESRSAPAASKRKAEQSFPPRKKKNMPSHPSPAGAPSGFHPTSEELKLLKDLHRRTFDYFLHEADPHTGLVKDRAGNFSPDTYVVSSIAATGFGLAALAVGAKRGYLSHEESYRKTLDTLRFISTMYHLKGWLYHFVDMKTGERLWKCEVSTIDTALFIAGALAAGVYFKGTEAEKLARGLYERMDFNFMQTDGGAKPDELTICHGWRPEEGFLKSRWDHYDELATLYFLALGSPTHPVPNESWAAWKRTGGKIGPYTALGIEMPLFVHQYVHCFYKMRGRKDALGEDLWKNSVTATLANRWMCIQHAAEFPGFGPEGWGISAVDGPDGYRAYDLSGRDIDGTLSPIGVAAAVPLAPEIAIPTLLHMKKSYGTKIWGRYGFSAYNLKRDWRGKDMVGIDAGAALLLLDRYIYKDDFIPGLLERGGQTVGLQRAGFILSGEKL
jgi:hypothetical protein